MRLCLIGGVIILLVIIIGILPPISWTYILTGVQSPLWSRRRRTELVSFISWISVSLYAICAGYLLFSFGEVLEG